jgi:L,D-transpeptidase YcbB
MLLLQSSIRLISIAAIIFSASVTYGNGGITPGPVQPEFSDSDPAGLEARIPGRERIYKPELEFRKTIEQGNRQQIRWSDPSNIDQMVEAIENSRLHGLNPEDYHISQIRELLNQERRLAIDDMAVTILDSLLKDAFLQLSDHLATGKTDPGEADLQWDAIRRESALDREEFLDTTLEHKKVAEKLDKLVPRNPEYQNLKKAMAEYLQIEKDGGWESLSDTMPALARGMVHPGVSALRNRLAVTQGEIGYDPDNEDLFDDNLHEHVILFQQRNGIREDGIAGEETLGKLNIPVRDRIDLIGANMERWRWLGGDFGDNYIEVDITAYELRVIEDNRTVFVSDIIVGSQDRQTPVLSEVMTYLVVNPRWYIPPGILANDIVPEAADDTSYLEERDFMVLDGEMEKVDPETIDWDGAAERAENEEDLRFPYQVVQKPGASNEMGRVKFMFPNQYHVYIHDSPHQRLFDEHGRYLSSGCIRIKQPFQLLEYLLQDNPDWDLDSIKETFGEEEEHEVALEKPVDVHVLYLTARADENGVVFFRQDIYDRDKQLLNALKVNRN